ncbi:hypothetical protein Desor_2451 [Desulfosporosinus orientis DSM 765]|uniref:Uncharacterized protein n=1 Tax=Desulfosporosinus orientis (strain ATCC 19365 / DSM 765 / NCIMB 8382 / VKM B-1628 / Singapore I) TaxID=768706 RepID=G7WFD6_DESOD|nr:hypothetical protein Desor_2451 [Desulfosporosinus orientis DSM 765]
MQVIRAEDNISSVIFGSIDRWQGLEIENSAVLRSD